MAEGLQLASAVAMLYLGRGACLDLEVLNASITLDKDKRNSAGHFVLGQMLANPIRCVRLAPSCCDWSHFAFHQLEARRFHGPSFRVQSILVTPARVMSWHAPGLFSWHHPARPP
jgi:hypothetical protein